MTVYVFADVPRGRCFSVYGDIIGLSDSPDVFILEKLNDHTAVTKGWIDYLDGFVSMPPQQVKLRSQLAVRLEDLIALMNQ